MNTASEHQLDEVTIKQLVWKPGIVRNLAVDIVAKVLTAETVWPDEFSHTDLPDTDRHVIGIAWRMLNRAGVIQQTGNYRKSKSANRNGGAVFEYEVKSRTRAHTFLQRNGRTAIEPNQPELFRAN
ncbi:MAG: hypothetical protein ACLP2Y_02755 [Limisphaerales bacterium]